MVGLNSSVSNGLTIVPELGPKGLGSTGGVSPSWNPLDTPFDPAASKWNTPPGSTRVAHAGMRSKIMGLSSWDDANETSTSYGRYAAASTDPLWEVVYHADAWTNRFSGAWTRNSVPNATTVLAACSNTFPYDYHRFASQVAGTPTPPAAGQYIPRTDPATPPRKIRMPANALPAFAPDGHLCVYQPSGFVFEGYACTVLAAQRKIICLTYQMISPTLLGNGYQNGPRASMIPAIAGLLRQSDLNQTTINHAIAIVVPPDVLTTSWVDPALAFDTDALTNGSPYSGDLPMGTKLTVPTSFDPSALDTVAGRKIGRAIKNYGAIIVDRGGAGVTILTELGITTPSNVATYDWGLDVDLQAIRAVWEVAT